MNTETLDRIEHSISSMHYANQTVSSAYGSELSVVESSILVELLCHPKQQAKILARNLLLSPVVISRAMKDLRQKSFIRTNKNGRSLETEVTAKGKQTFFAMHLKTQEIFRAAYLRLQKSEQAVFEQTLLRMLFNLNAPPAARLENDPPLMENARRMTRALGLISNTIYFHKEINPLEWHVLRKLALQLPGDPPLLARTIAEQLGVEKNTLFPAVRRMVGKQLIAQEPSTSDRREKPLILLPEGRKEYEAGRTAGKKLLKIALKNFTDAELEVLPEIWEKYTGVKNQPALKNLASGYQMLVIDDSDFRQKARTFLYTARVAANQLENLPSVVIGEQGSSLALIKDSKIMAVIEFADQKLLHFIEINSDGKKDRIPLNILKRFWQMGLQKIVFGRDKNIKIQRDSCTARTWKIVR